MILMKFQRGQHVIIAVNFLRIYARRVSFKKPETMDVVAPSDNSTCNGSTKDTEVEPTFKIDTMPYTSVTEGKAEVLFPSANDVFYNPVQEFNRDLSIAVLRVFASLHKDMENERLSKVAEKKRKKSFSNEDGIKKSESVIKCDNKENSKEAKSENYQTEKNQESENKITDHKEKDDFIERKGQNDMIPNSESIKEFETESERKESVTLYPPGVKDENGISILEALAASGLRSIRYAHEVGGVKEIIANDLSGAAVECMKRNITHNKVDHLITSSHSDASMVMYQHREPKKRFNAIDLDPYGSPHIFLDAAVQSVTDGGIMLVTCTDMAVLCGNTPETCYIKYGATSLKSKACHEMALRIVLQSIESHANRYGRYIVPLLSMSADFYVRVVVQVFTSQQKCKETFSKVGWVYQCVGCDSTVMQPLGTVVRNGKSVKYQVSRGPPVKQNCEHCNGKYNVAGPIWLAPIHDVSFLQKLKASLKEEDFKTFRRIYGTITMMEEELQDVPLFYVIDRLASIAGVSLPKSTLVRSALLNAGYRVSYSHACKASLKTDAPTHVIWDMVREWDKVSPANRSKMAADRPGRIILEKEQKTKISFEVHPDANPESRNTKLLRFQVAPEKNWGPACRSRTSLFQNDQEDKRVRNQGKKRSKEHVAEKPNKIIKDEKDITQKENTTEMEGINS